MNISQVLLPLLVGLLFTMGCGDQASRFDFSKVIAFEFTRNPQATSYDTLANLDVVNFDDLKAYKKYGEGYRVNQLMYEIVVMEENVADLGAISGTVSISGQEQDLFEISELSISSEGGVLTVSNEMLIALSEEIDRVGVLSVSIHSEADETPASFNFILKLDVTVSVNFDIL